MENREMFSEINALVGMVAKAFDTSEIEVITAIEQGRLGMELMTDEDGQNFISATFDDKTVRIYQGAIFRPDDSPEEEECETGGCSCGH